MSAAPLPASHADSTPVAEAVNFSCPLRLPPVGDLPQFRRGQPPKRRPRRTTDPVALAARSSACCSRHTSDSAARRRRTRRPRLPPTRRRRGCRVGLGLGPARRGAPRPQAAPRIDPAHHPRRGRRRTHRLRRHQAASVHPLDEQLQLPRRSFSYPLQQSLVRSAVQGPFDEAVADLRHDTGVKFEQTLPPSRSSKRRPSISTPSTPSTRRRPAPSGPDPWW